MHSFSVYIIWAVLLPHTLTQAPNLPPECQQAGNGMLSIPKCKEIFDAEMAKQKKEFGKFVEREKNELPGVNTDEWRGGDEQKQPNAGKQPRVSPGFRAGGKNVRGCNANVAKNAKPWEHKKNPDDVKASQAFYKL